LADGILLVGRSFGRFSDLDSRLGHGLGILRYVCGDRARVNPDAAS
jgi:hypothetical protein